MRAEIEAQILGLEQELRALPDEQQHGLVTVDPETGEQEQHGVIIKKRAVADVTVWLTYSKADRMWWITWQSDRLCKMAYVEARRKICWQTFFELTEAQMRDLEHDAQRRAADAT